MTLLPICRYGYHRDLHSFPTRRSSDLPCGYSQRRDGEEHEAIAQRFELFDGQVRGLAELGHVCDERHGHALLIECVRSEEHTSELQSQFHLVCRLLLEKKKLLLSSPPL